MTEVGQVESQFPQKEKVVALRNEEGDRGATVNLQVAEGVQREYKFTGYVVDEKGQMAATFMTGSVAERVRVKSIPLQDLVGKVTDLLGNTVELQVNVLRSGADKPETGWFVAGVAEREGGPTALVMKTDREKGLLKKSVPLSDLVSWNLKAT